MEEEGTLFPPSPPGYGGGVSGHVEDGGGSGLPAGRQAPSQRRRFARSS
jgi:hypothetical protein